MRFFFFYMLLICFGLLSCGTTQEPGIRLNELFAKGSGSSDWLELYNPSSLEVSLEGYQLVDKQTGTKWSFPNGTVISALGFLKVVCDDSGKNGNANFKLTSKGETISLLSKEGVELDSVVFPEQTPDTSWGRFPDGTGVWKKMTQPTAGAKNIE